MNYWQIASGSEGREFSQFFTLYGIAFVGGDVSREKIKNVKIGDRVILKSGMSILAVGEIVPRDGKHLGEDDKDWLKDFDGWNLGAYCYVDWSVLPQPQSMPGLTRATIQNVHQQPLKDFSEKTLKEFPPINNYAPEPILTKEVSDQEILEFLVYQGLRPKTAEDLTSAFKRIRLLIKYYWECSTWQDIREHETRTFLIIPLLLALGWAEQQIKIELPVAKGRADIACFSKPYKKNDGKSNDEDCFLIIETKGFNQGLDLVKDQAESYSVEFPNCKTIVVSNGYSYRVFRKSEDGKFGLNAYLNLLRPRDKYPLDPSINGCLEALKLLLPY